MLPLKIGNVVFKLLGDASLAIFYRTLSPAHFTLHWGLGSGRNKVVIHHRPSSSERPPPLFEVDHEQLSELLVAGFPELLELLRFLHDKYAVPLSVENLHELGWRALPHPDFPTEEVFNVLAPRVAEPMFKEVRQLRDEVFLSDGAIDDKIEVRLQYLEDVIDEPGMLVMPDGNCVQYSVRDSQLFAHPGSEEMMTELLSGIERILGKHEAGRLLLERLPAIAECIERTIAGSIEKNGAEP